MLPALVAILAALAYLGLLFAVASYGDRRAASLSRPRSRPGVYALALGVYCTSWTFFGSVGLAASSGLDFLTIYLGPILVFTLGFPVLRHIVRVSKAERITSIADFLGSRYGKSGAVAVTATMIAGIGVVPYIALQLKAVSTSILTLAPSLAPYAARTDGAAPLQVDLAFPVTALLALFAILFGTRQAEATEHQEGMMLAIAVESVVKLAAFTLVGLFVTFVLFSGPGDLFERALAVSETRELLTAKLDGGRWLVMTCLSAFAILLLPRQFHVAVVENRGMKELRRARWLFPAYLVGINVFVVPIALGGLLLQAADNADQFVLALPAGAGVGFVTLVAFIGGLSAATAMVIVASVALAIMVSNEVVIPLVLRRAPARRDAQMARFILNVRRVAIACVLLLGYAYYRVATDAMALASIGLLSFAAIAQLAPAFLGGLMWRRATAPGAIAGMASGLTIWAYTLLLPVVVTGTAWGRDFVEEGPFGFALLAPHALLHTEFDPLVHGVFWSLLANVAAFVGVSLSRRPTPVERLQANVFVPAEGGRAPELKLEATDLTIGELREAVARYLGEERSERAFAAFAEGRPRADDAPVDAHLVRHAEQLLASAIGSASSRLVLSLLLRRPDEEPGGAFGLLDDASQALQHNRELLQTALDQSQEGVGVFDRENRLIAWNRTFRQHLDLPERFGQVGVPLGAIIAFLVRAGLFGGGEFATLLRRELRRTVEDGRREPLRHPRTGRLLILEARSLAGGVSALTVADETERLEFEDALSRARDTLERRVEERTGELREANIALREATAAAENANLGKTRFIAAAGHDVLQPLNAARLYAGALGERAAGTEHALLAKNVEAALNSVEEIFRSVLEISHLDTGSLKPETSDVSLSELFGEIEREFRPVAEVAGLKLTIMPTSLGVRTDRQLLRRLVQNLVSNALKYTSRGRVLVGCRRRGGRVSIQVIDTGLGIAEADQAAIFEEFRRLAAGAKAAPGLGLGLSIVERIARVLDVELFLRSELGRGTAISVMLERAEVAAVRPSVPAAPVPAHDLTGMSVLCVDNDPDILDAMTTLLTGWGCSVVTADNVTEAIGRQSKAGVAPDLVLVDYHLDDDDGLAAIERIRDVYEADTPAALVTADRSKGVVERARAQSIGILNKPVKPAALRSLMSRHHVRREAAE